ncbi:Mobile element protein [Candidatus Enterovibrio escicola]|uniref:Mobile element protein n=1 Tax=Candidatus Enterovibrio escicola TaxID=1927127 RepID=A0A2A5T0S4_9GAMM|nr:transposase [Candidatus Enterovibrio escacola]PCS21746.1 Mobile element protein [Candidatus Enterovibrio escacola]
MPSLIRPSYRFITTDAFSDIMFCMGTAKRGKGTMWRFYGFKLHLIINDQGSITSVKVTTANVDDRKPISEMVNAI